MSLQYKDSLGLWSICPRSYKTYQNCVKRLHRLAHKKAVCHWTHEQEDAFEKIKDAVSKAPVLKYCSESDPTEG